MLLRRRPRRAALAIASIGRVKADIDIFSRPPWAALALFLMPFTMTCFLLMTGDFNAAFLRLQLRTSRPFITAF